MASMHNKPRYAARLNAFKPLAKGRGIEGMIEAAGFAMTDQLKTDLVDLMMIAGLSGHEDRVRRAFDNPRYRLNKR